MINTSKIKSLGWKPKYSLKQGIEKTIIGIKKSIKMKRKKLI